jgi:hypothetical protein
MKKVIEAHRRQWRHKETTMLSIKNPEAGYGKVQVPMTAPSKVVTLIFNEYKTTTMRHPA